MKFCLLLLCSQNCYKNLRHDPLLAELISIYRTVLFQGRLGDCWFLSAVAVLTEASCISEVIITPEYNEEGIYTVRFCIQVCNDFNHWIDKYLLSLVVPFHYKISLSYFGCYELREGSVDSFCKVYNIITVKC